MSEAYLAEIAEQPGILDRLGARFAATWGRNWRNCGRGWPLAGSTG